MSDHPDLEALSAWLDGQPDASSVAPHVDSCRGCQSRVAELRAVQAAVGAPVPPVASDFRDAALARALAAADQPETEAPAPAELHSLGTAGTRRRRQTTSARGREGRRWWLVPAAASAAAAVLAAAVVGTVSLLGRGPADDSPTALSTGPSDRPSAESAAPGGTEPVHGGDLGDMAEVATVRERAQARTAAAASGRALTALDSGAPAPESTAPVPRIIGTRVCEVEARTARPDVGVLVYVANLRYRGTPAVALGFADQPAAPPIRLLVLAPAEGCRVLAESTTP
jgi:hypothetical protein